MIETNTHSGSLFMVVAPSGAGKSTLVNALLAQEPAAGGTTWARILFHDGGRFFNAAGSRGISGIG
jgi:ABC-type multidrug transport system ATPase subunit